MDTLIALRAALNSWATVPRDQVTAGEESVPGARSDQSSVVLAGVKPGRV